MPAKAGIQGFTEAGRWSLWIPAFAGMTICKRRRETRPPSCPRRRASRASSRPDA